jgi:hypothetical protein
MKQFSFPVLMCGFLFFLACSTVSAYTIHFYNDTKFTFTAKVDYAAAKAKTFTLPPTTFGISCKGNAGIFIQNIELIAKEDPTIKIKFNTWKKTSQYIYITLTPDGSFTTQDYYSKSGVKPSGWNLRVAELNSLRWQRAVTTSDTPTAKADKMTKTAPAAANTIPEEGSFFSDPAQDDK